jgi:2',3'-cyclic-nucleotide 2'-phosphodiesterase (5'-nucleotidase family)
VRGREAAIGNLIADAMRERTRADVAIMNGGGIRGGKVYEPARRSRRRDVQAELPFGNHLVTLNIKGADCALPSRTACRGLPPPPAVSAGVGHDDRVRSAAAAGSRVLSIAVGGAPLDPDKFYRVAVNDFMARGGDGYAPLPRSIRCCRSTIRRCCPTR